MYVYYHDLFYQNANDIRRTWNIINTIMQRKGKPATLSAIKKNGDIQTGKQLADSFNSFFLDAGAPDVTCCYDDKFMPPPEPTNFNFAHISYNDILTNIKQLRDGAAPGYDEINSTVLKFSANSVTHL